MYVCTYMCVIATYHLHKIVCGLNECTGTSTVLYTNEPLVVTMVIYRRWVGHPGKIVIVLCSVLVALLYLTD